jgi:glycolate oxidase
MFEAPKSGVDALAAQPAPIAFREPSAAVLANAKALAAGLARLLPRGALVADEIGRRAFDTDVFSAYRRTPLAVALPTSTGEVSAVLKFCHDNGVKVVARGAGTSLSGGAIPTEDSVVLCLSRMSRVLDINLDARCARVQAGATNLAISAAAGRGGFFYAPDPSSQFACTIGGNVATNAGGAHCLKYGVTTQNLLGATMVMMDGEVVSFGGPAPSPMGYDFLALIAGSEGQLGVVTEVDVRIQPLPENARPMLLGFSTAEAAGSCVAGIIGAGIVPSAIEFMDKLAIEVCEQFAHAGYPLDVDALLIVEVEGAERETQELIDRITVIAQSYAPRVIRISESDEETAAIWKGRKAAFSAMGRVSDYLCMDGVIPLSRLSETLSKVERIARAYGLRAANIFHAGDGNLHPLIMYDANDEEQRLRAEACGAEILKICVEAGGCLTGEHGVGLEKRELMLGQFYRADLAQQMRVKRAFDPRWLLNPDKVFPLAIQDDFIAGTAAGGEMDKRAADGSDR